MTEIVFVEVSDLSQISSSGVGKIWSNPGYNLKETTTGVTDRPDVWNEENKKSKVTRCK